MFDRENNVLIVKSNGVVEKGIIIPSDLLAGRNVSFWGGIKAEGEVSLGRGCIVKGEIKARKGLIGPHSRIKKIEVEEDVKIFDHCRIDQVIAGGNVYIRRGCIIGMVKAGKNVILDGMSKITDIKAGEKVIALDSDKNII